MEVSNDNVKEIIAMRIQQFRSLDPDKYSYKFMSRKTGLSPSYIERAAKVKLGGVLDPKKTMALAGLICGPEETRLIASVLVNGFINDSNNLLKQALLEQFSKERNIEDKEIERALEEDEVFIAYALCANSNGATLDKLRMVLGDAGNIGLKKLERLDLVHEENGRYIASTGKKFGQYESIKKQLAILSRLYKPSNVGKEKNYVHIMTDGLDAEGLKLWQEEHRNHQERLRQIKKNHKGEIDVFSVGFMDTFLPE